MFGFLSFNTVVKAEENDSERIILIDPGHGGMDGGGKGSDGTLEKDINLAIALKLKTALEGKRYKVEMTRDTDTDLHKKGETVREKKRDDLANRVKRKEETKCDAFISIHQNMFPQSNCKGAQVWYAQDENSKFLGEALQESFKINLDEGNHRLAKQAKEEYRILRNNKECAAVIAECGFLSNPEELQLLKSDDYQNKIVDSIVNGIDKYFS
ncbi:MAG: N-acetylmuramoyl-L-alanine amidase CwlD [Clostridium perfringens]|nr:N-acetylmuramoyl-L-alanine amidase CwlD [Clostridium perfringens]